MKTMMGGMPPILCQPLKFFCRDRCTVAPLQITADRDSYRACFKYEREQVLCLTSVPPIRLLEAHNEQALSMTLQSDIHMGPSCSLMRIIQAHPRTALHLYRYKDKKTSTLSTGNPASRNNFLFLCMLFLKKGEQVTWLAKGEKAHELLEEIRMLNEHNWHRPDIHTASRLRVSFHHRPHGNITLETEKAFEYFKDDLLSVVASIDGKTIIIGPQENHHNELAKHGKISSNYIRLLVQKDDIGIMYSYIAGDSIQPVSESKLIDWFNKNTTAVLWFDPKIHHQQSLGAQKK